MPSRRQRFVTYGISSFAAATVATAALLVPWTQPTGSFTCCDEPTYATPPVPDDPSASAIDVVFAIDTTGSMSGLIDGARRTVWSIATHIRDLDPNAHLRIGLVAYRDIDPGSTSNGGYVTKPLALTTDLDSVFSELSSYEAKGGGDTPENVAAGLHQARVMRWRANAKKLIFVVGDAPPVNRGEVAAADVAVRAARVDGITVNAIRVGVAVETASAFESLAALGGGEYSSIAQDGGVQQIATPYDDKLAELSTTIDRTAVIAGDDAAREGYASRMAVAAAAPAATKADRAGYYAKTGRARPGADARAAGDVVAAFEAGTLDPATVPSKSLPSEFQGKSSTEIKAELARRAGERKQARQEIEKLTKERDAYLAKQRRNDGFDAAVKATVEKQLKR